MSKDNTPPKKVKDLRLNIRLSPQEWDKIHRLAANTTCRSVSEYARKVLAKQPVTVFYRNQSFDIFEEHMTRLLAQLDTFSDNNDQPGFLRTVEVIKFLIEKIADKCDPK